MELFRRNKCIFKENSWLFSLLEFRWVEEDEKDRGTSTPNPKRRVNHSMKREPSGRSS